MRALSIAFLRDQLAQQIERVPACVLRCYPHEWSVLYTMAPRGEKATRAKAAWRYAGRFATPPRPEQIEGLLKQQMTRARDEGAPEAARPASPESSAD